MRPSGYFAETRIDLTDADAENAGLGGRHAAGQVQALHGLDRAEFTARLRDPQRGHVLAIVRPGPGNDIEELDLIGTRGEPIADLERTEARCSHAVAAMPITATPTPAGRRSRPQVDRGRPAALTRARCAPGAPRRQERVTISLSEPSTRKTPSPTPSGAATGPPAVHA